MNPLRSWSDLPVEILGLFLDRLIFVDHVHFAAVCKSWRSAAAKHHHHRALQLPWLLLSQDPTALTWGFFSPAEGRAYHLVLPVPRGSRCSGSSHGWFFMTDRNLGNHHLLNPFTNQQIQIPRTSTLPSQFPPGCLEYFRKAIMSSPPPPPAANDNGAAIDCVVVATYRPGCKLTFCRPGDETWSDFPKVLEREDFEDFIFRDELLYCVNYKGEVVVFEFGPQPSAKAIYHPKRMDHNYSLLRAFYLVESAGELLMVVRHWGITNPKTVGFSVFKLDPTATEWIQVKSLGDGMLFLGTGCSKYITTANTFGFRPNCIHFTHDDCAERSPNFYDGPNVLDWGIFCLDDGAVHSYRLNNSWPFRCPPLWIMLNA